MIQVRASPDAVEAGGVASARARDDLPPVPATGGATPRGASDAGTDVGSGATSRAAGARLRREPAFGAVDAGAEEPGPGRTRWDDAPAIAPRDPFASAPAPGGSPPGAAQGLEAPRVAESAAMPRVAAQGLDARRVAESPAVPRAAEGLDTRRAAEGLDTQVAESAVVPRGPRPSDPTEPIGRIPSAPDDPFARADAERRRLEREGDLEFEAFCGLLPPLPPPRTVTTHTSVEGGDAAPVAMRAGVAAAAALATATPWPTPEPAWVAPTPTPAPLAADDAAETTVELSASESVPLPLAPRDHGATGRIVAALAAGLVVLGGGAYGVWVKGVAWNTETDVVEVRKDRAGRERGGGASGITVGDSDGVGPAVAGASPAATGAPPTDATATATAAPIAPPFEAPTPTGTAVPTGSAATTATVTTPTHIPTTAPVPARSAVPTGSAATPPPPAATARAMPPTTATRTPSEPAVPTATPTPTTTATPIAAPIGAAPATAAPATGAAPTGAAPATAAPATPAPAAPSSAAASSARGAAAPPSPTPAPTRAAESRISPAAPADALPPPPPPPSAGPPDLAQVRAAVASRQPVLDACLAAALRAPGGERLAGRSVALRLRIEPAGLTSAALDDATLDAAAVGVCVRGAAAGLSFPPFEGMAVELELPLPLGPSAR